VSRNELARAASLVIQHAEQLRVDCEEELLADIGTGGYNAQLVAFIARTLAEEERDPLLLDSLNALKSADTAATRAAFNAYRLGCRAHKDGQYKDAIPHFRAVRLLNASIDLERQHNVLNGVVRAATREGYSFAAALIHDGVLAVAEQGSKPLFVADAWLTRSQFMLSNADFPGAKLCMTH